ncbi:MAG: GNAT family N-acetyltransferase [Mucilaginibacter sp.]|nr:GNAT family N-acetyltransferase [Mucilaginibacter sp.]
MNEVIQMKGYHIERLSKVNINSLEKLYHEVYGRSVAPGYYSKKYDTSYTGVEHVGYIAFNERHNPIAYYGVIPCFIRYGDQLYLAAQSADTMTHPKYQFKGLFVQLANLTFDLSMEEGISLIFGFPNQNSLHGFLVRLKWQMTETLAYYNIATGMISLDSVTRKIPFLKKVYEHYQEYILKDYLVSKKGIENAVFKEGFAGVNRNALYLNYKKYSDTRVIQIGDALLWIKIKNGLVVGDVSCPSGEFDTMLINLKKLAMKLGLKNIQFHTSHQTRLSWLLSSRYPAQPSFYVLFKDLGSRIPLDKIKFTYADVDTF